MGYWKRELRLWYLGNKDKPILRSSWDFAIYINLCLGITDLLLGKEPTFLGFLIGLLVGFPVAALLELAFRKWARRMIEREDTPSPAGAQQITSSR